MHMYNHQLLPLSSPYFKQPPTPIFFTLHPISPPLPHLCLQPPISLPPIIPHPTHMGFPTQTHHPSHSTLLIHPIYTTIRPPTPLHSIPLQTPSTFPKYIRGREGEREREKEGALQEELWCSRERKREKLRYSSSYTTTQKNLQYHLEES